MSKEEASKIEKTLRKVVRDAAKNGETVTVRLVRKRAEEKLGLEADLLKSGPWRAKSKIIIEDAFSDDADDAEKPAEKQGQSVPTPVKKSQKEMGQDTPGAVAKDKSKEAAPRRPEPTAPKVNGVKRKAAEVEPAAQNGVATMASSAEKKSHGSPSKKAKVSTPKDLEKSSGSEETETDSSPARSSESESGSGSGSKNENSSSADEEAQDTPSPEISVTEEPAESLQAIPSKTFRPPSGYIPITSAMLAESGAFADTELGGKQLWHITAPSNVPLSALTELSLSAIQSGGAVLSHKNISYVLDEDITVGAESTVLLAPSTEGYRKVKSTISRSLRLQQKIELPDLSALQASQNTGSNAAGNVAQASVNTVRPQPSGLRMRYKPPGFGKGKPGKIGSAGNSEEDEDDDENRGPSFQFPKTLGQHGVEVRQTGDVEMVDAANLESGGGSTMKKKAKKKHREKEQDLAHGDVPKTNGETAGKAGPSATASPYAALSNGDGTEKESKEARRRRKEEKRARKEAKAKAKEVTL